MARYINADKFTAELEQEKTAALEFGDGVAAYEIEHTMNLISMQPTADVVPKSEIERLKDKYEIIYQPKGMIEANAKANVAREIFEEISKASADWGCYCISSTKWGYVTHDVSRTLAELKKKYTGEK